MNFIESFLFNRLSKSPEIKNFLKISYQLIMVFLFGKKSTLGNCRSIFELQHAFVGFHDVQPYSANRDILAVHRSNDNFRRHISEESEVDILICNLKTGDLTTIDTTRAFNWQMGSRLQFDSKDHLVWNAIVNNRLISYAMDENGRRKEQKYSIYSLCRTSALRATVNFSSIEKQMPGYGYVGTFQESTLSNEILIWSRDLSVERIFDLSSTANELNFGDSYFITHLQFNPSGTLLGFFIREASNEFNYRTRLCVLDVESGKVVYNFENSDIVTHYCWNEDEIIAFSKLGNEFNYLELNLAEKKNKKLSPLTRLPDGHPSIFAGRFLITDTYPDRERKQNLYLSDLQSGDISLLGRFYSPFRFRGYHRVDLHPRFLSNDTICIDKSVSGCHTVEVLKVF